MQTPEQTTARRFLEFLRNDMKHLRTKQRSYIAAALRAGLTTEEIAEESGLTTDEIKELTNGGD